MSGSAQKNTEAFNNLKKLTTHLPSLVQYNSNSEKIPTTDASTIGLGAALWQKRKDGICEQIDIRH